MGYATAGSPRGTSWSRIDRRPVACLKRSVEEFRWPLTCATSVTNEIGPSRPWRRADSPTRSHSQRERLTVPALEPGLPWPGPKPRTTERHRGRCVDQFVCVLYAPSRSHPSSVSVLASQRIRACTHTQRRPPISPLAISSRVVRSICDNSSTLVSRSRVRPERSTGSVRCGTADRGRHRRGDSAPGSPGHRGAGPTD